MIEQKKYFREKLDELVNDTSFLSGNYLSDPSSGGILSFDGTKAVPWLLEYLRECKQNPKSLDTNPWVAFEALSHFVPKEYLPYVSPSQAGKLDQLFYIFDKWGVERGLLFPSM